MAKKKIKKKPSKAEVAARGAMVGAAVGGVAGAAVSPAASPVGAAVGGYVGSTMAPKVIREDKMVPPARELILEARMLWERYRERPNKTRLRDVARHCDKMKASKAKTVKEERQCCMRAVRAEQKRLGVK